MLCQVSRNVPTLHRSSGSDQRGNLQAFEHRLLRAAGALAVADSVQVLDPAFECIMEIELRSVSTGQHEGVHVLAEHRIAGPPPPSTRTPDPQ